MVKIYVWKPHNHSFGGHVSMDIAFGEPGRADYVSWWPANQDDLGKILFFGVPAKVHSYVEDLKPNPIGEGVNPDWTMEFYDLNESKMLTTWNLIKNGNINYSVQMQNCATTVAYVLALSDPTIFKIVCAQMGAFGLDFLALGVGAINPIIALLSLPACTYAPWNIITLCYLISARNYL